MRVLVLGSGAREHALVARLALDPEAGTVLAAPGNPGIARVAHTIPIDLTNVAAVAELAASERIDLTVVGPELPLSLGLADRFAADGRLLFGPTAAAARLESSKAFAKTFMARHAVPTARFHVAESLDSARAQVHEGAFGFPVVLKADGLAAGKGVVIADDASAADAAIVAAMADRKFGGAGERLVIEECLSGPEVSFFLICDGTRALSIGSAQDHKRIFDDDRGPNTGGMGAFAPSPLVTSEIERRVVDEVVWPVLDGMQHEGHPYRGFLYVGLMLTADGPKVVEFNVRLGDPETQVVLPMLDEELSWLLGEAAMGALPSRPARFHAAANVGVVLAAGGYPEAVETGQPISGIDQAAAVPDALVFHAGTSEREGQLVTSGGRVLTVVGRGQNFSAAIDTAYRAASHIRFEGMQFRSDIGRKALKGAIPDPITEP